MNHQAQAQVAGLKHEVFAAQELSEMWHLEAIAAKRERDTALEKARVLEAKIARLIKAGDALLVDGLTGIARWEKAKE